MINREEFPAAVTYASQFRREDFPRHHYLPPDPYARILDGQAPFRILEHLDGTEPGWLREVWLGQAVEYFTLNAGQLTSKSLPEAVFAGFPELKALRDAEAGERRR